MGLVDSQSVDHELIASVIDQVPRGSYVNGRWRDSSGRTFPVLDPATGETLVELSDADHRDAQDALDSAVAKSDEWSSIAPRERSELLRRIYDRIMEQSELIATLITLEMGKPIAEARGEVAYGAEFMRWFAEEAVRIEGNWLYSPTGDSRLVTIKQPVGPCLLITPWNFPLAMVTRKIAPALAAGCCIVLKPAEQAPLTALWLVKMLAEEGLPHGVLNAIVTSSPGEVVTPLLSDSRLRKVSFTGSTAVGKRLLSQAGENVLRVSMELGGNAPFIVFDDASLDETVDAAMVAKLRNMGESCVAANRFLVHTSLADRFAARLADRMNALKLGHGLDLGTQVGPMISNEHRSKVAGLVDDAVRKGAVALSPPKELPGRGFFVQPQVLIDVPPDARLLSEEVFGPVASIRSFSTDEQAVADANNTESGLVAFIFTRDLHRATRVTEALEVGMVGVNRGLVSNPSAPFGGTKHSGLGREGGRQGIDEYLETKYVAIDTPSDRIS